MTLLLKEHPTKAKEKAPSPHDVRLPCWTPIQYFNVLGGKAHGKPHGLAKISDTP